MAIKPVKHFISTFAGAPVLTGQAGALIAVLDACLVDGFNLLTLDSLVVSGNVLTGTKAGHGFVVDQVIATSANEAELIGEWTITSVTSGTFSAVATGVADVTGTGTLTAKAASAGWLKVFSGTNKAAYKSADPAATGMILRVDDTGTTAARVVGYESMTDIDTGVGPFPTPTQIGGGGYWTKSNSADSTARRWLIVIDEACLYLTVNHVGTTKHLAAFGDYASEKTGDAYRCMLQCWYSNMANTGGGWSAIGYHGFSDPGQNYLHSPRSYTQIGTSVLLTTSFIGKQNVPSGASGGMAFPSMANNGLIIGGIVAKEMQIDVIRCLALPGIYATPQALPMIDLDKVGDISALPGRTLIAAEVWINSAQGRVFFDLTGPWR